MVANDPRLMAKSESYIAKLMESIVVIKVAIGVKKAELMSLHQVHDEQFRMFATVYAANQKPAISLQSVSVTVGKAM